MWELSILFYVRSIAQEAWEASVDQGFAESLAHKIPPHFLIFWHDARPAIIGILRCGVTKIQYYGNDSLAGAAEDIPAL
jgi:hypothetical protein